MMRALLVAVVKAALSVGLWILSCSLKTTYFLYSKRHHLKMTSLASNSNGSMEKGNFSILIYFFKTREHWLLSPGSIYVNNVDFINTKAHFTEK